MAMQNNYFEMHFEKYTLMSICKMQMCFAAVYFTTYMMGFFFSNKNPDVMATIGRENNFQTVVLSK